MDWARRIQAAANAIVRAATPADVFEFQESYAKYGKVFVADIATILNTPLEIIKPIMLELHNQGLISMHRADLVRDEEISVREASVIKKGNASFHQVRGYR
jgi:transcription initiation factor IIE alpha subunit